MTTEITDDVYWINNCYDAGDEHVHVSVYLIRAEDGDILVDTGSYYHEERIEAQVDAVTDDLEAIVLTHSDLHHSENTAELRERYGGAELYTSFTGSTASPEVLGMGSATQCPVGESTTIAGRTIGFPWPPLSDRVQTTWIHDAESETLFAADGFGHYHAPGECDRLSTDFEDGIPYGRIRDFHRDTLPWLPYVDPSKLIDGIGSLFEEWPVENVAPIHGNPLVGGDVEGYLDDLEDVLVEAADSYREPGAAD